MEDVRFCAIQERNYMILKAICDSDGPEMFEAYRQRYRQEDIFVSYFKGTTMRTHMDGQVSSGRFFDLKSNRLPQDENNLVGFQE